MYISELQCISSCIGASCYSCIRDSSPEEEVAPVDRAVPLAQAQQRLKVRKRQQTLGSTPFASPSVPANEGAVPAPSPPLESSRTCLTPPASGGPALSGAITGPAGPLFMLWRR
ncbi:hypothetical protein M440DRAFT_1388815 [Trichoderma longibrachiatum ATCC 18648]|uniref:Uncharacterized protein n=1 Tax=Trichoderma longibrachiatum ATCC 18648 TaxID=983965 RepID=A0A2T4CG98_TRILO|nr:hypothetical protein M440DRAFT_1388815 [Trichoderma longibrachiatum ATCC 18648]